MAVDKNGVPYVAYQDGGSYDAHLTVMKYDGSSWVTVGSPGFSAGGAVYLSIALDTSGTPYVAYLDVANGEKATVMKYDGTSWVTVGVAGFSASVAESESLAIDRSGTPYVAYMDFSTGVAGGQATVMKYNGSSWENVGSPGFSDSAVQTPGIAIDNSGTPYVVYQDERNGYKATVKKFDGSSWVTVGTEGFSAALAQYTCIAVDTGGTPYVFYSDYTASGAATVKKFSGGSWVTVGSVGFSSTWNCAYNTMAIDRNGTPYVAYENGVGSGSAMTYSGSSWIYAGSSIFSGGAVRWTSVATVPDGRVFVAYGDAANGNKATVMQLIPPAGPITGTDTLCISSTTTLSDTTTGGTWTSSDPSIASIGPGTGLVTAVSAGVVIITYTTVAGSVYFTLTVSGPPYAGAISGAAIACMSAVDVLSDAAPGGTWSSSDAGVATVGPTGTVTGVSTGSVTISYSVSNSCGPTAVATLVVSVNPAPDAGNITGLDSLCPADTVTFMDTVTGGAWGSTNTAVAIVSGGGMVTGLLPGADTITYAVTIGGCTTTAIFPVIVRPVAICATGVRAIAGEEDGAIEIAPNPNQGVFTFRLASKFDEEVRLVIMDVVGEKVKELVTATNQKTEINFNAARGVYFITAVSPTGKQTAKIVVQ